MTVPSYIENIRNFSHKDSELPIGVYRQRGTPRPYKAQIVLNGKTKYLGVFNTPYAAHMQVQYTVFNHCVDCLHRYKWDSRFDILIAMSIVMHLENIAEDMRNRKESRYL